MPLSKYYRILGLSNSASQDEVRRAFRKLAMKYHPDRNPSPFAAKKFIELTEAYEILMGKKSPPRAVQSRSSSPTQSKPNNRKSEEDIKKRAQEARQRYAEQIMQERLENQRYFKSLTSGIRWKVIRYLAIAGMIINCFLIADLILPKHYKSDRITEYSTNRAMSVNRKSLSLIKTESNTKYWISDIDYNLYMHYPDIQVESSWFFHSPSRIFSFETSSFRIYDIHFNFYRYTWLMLILFSIPALVIFFKKPTITFTFFFQIAYYGVGILMTLFLLTSDRWAHILTLGFI